MTPAAQRLLAVAECVAAMLDDSQIEIAIACLTRLAGRGRARNDDLERARAEREISDRRRA